MCINYKGGKIHKNQLILCRIVSQKNIRSSSKQRSLETLMAALPRLAPQVLQHENRVAFPYRIMDFAAHMTSRFLYRTHQIPSHPFFDFYLSNAFKHFSLSLGLLYVTAGFVSFSSQLIDM